MTVDQSDSLMVLEDNPLPAPTGDSNADLTQQMLALLGAPNAEPAKVLVTLREHVPHELLGLLGDEYLELLTSLGASARVIAESREFNLEAAAAGAQQLAQAKVRRFMEKHAEEIRQLLQLSQQSTELLRALAGLLYFRDLTKVSIGQIVEGIRAIDSLAVIRKRLLASLTHQIADMLHDRGIECQPNSGCDQYQDPPAHRIGGIWFPLQAGRLPSKQDAEQRMHIIEEYLRQHCPDLKCEVKCNITAMATHQIDIEVSGVKGAPKVGADVNAHAILRPLDADPPDQFSGKVIRSGVKCLQTSDHDQLRLEAKDNSSLEP